VQFLSKIIISNFPSNSTKRSFYVQVSVRHYQDEVQQPDRTTSQSKESSPRLWGTLILLLVKITKIHHDNNLFKSSVKDPYQSCFPESVYKNFLKKWNLILARLLPFIADVCQYQKCADK
jgi:hypothetical protein